MKHDVHVDNAPRFAVWIRERGGIAVWRSADLSDPLKSWCTPALTDGKPTPKPTWQARDTPEIVTDPAEIMVYESHELKRFHVGVRRGAQGFMLKLTDAATRRVRREIETSGPGSYYDFDYADYKNCVIYTTRDLETLKEWMENHESPA